MNTETVEEKEDREEFREGARNRKVFHADHLILGLPAKVFLLGCVLPLAVFFISKWYFAVILAAIYFGPMITIHKDDPRAFEVWKTTLFERTAGWEAGRAKSRVLVVLSDKS